MFSFNLNFGKKINYIYIYIYIDFEWWNELCYNVKIGRIGRKFTKERREFSYFSINFILANDRIIERILFIECVNMESRIMMWYDTTKRLMSSSKCRSVEVINNPARLEPNHIEVNYINYK